MKHSIIVEVVDTEKEYKWRMICGDGHHIMKVY